MDEKSIRARIKLGEDTTTEFKSVARTGFKMDSHDLAKAIAAMADTRGGQIFLGVDDDGGVSGTGGSEQTDGLMRQVSQV